jgi:hypothetical protein
MCRWMASRPTAACCYWRARSAAGSSDVTAVRRAAANRPTVATIRRKGRSGFDPDNNHCFLTPRLCEPELKLIGPPAAVGCITSSAYFESIERPENRAFVARWKSRHPWSLSWPNVLQAMIRSGEPPTSSPPLHRRLRNRHCLRLPHAQNSAHGAGYSVVAGQRLLGQYFFDPSSN